MATVKRFEELEAWQTARQLVNSVYDLTEGTAFARDFDLKGQIRRAAISVMSNIAEGFDSRTQAVFLDLLGRAKGSAAEVRSQLYVALDRRYIVQEQFVAVYELADKAARQIYRLMEYLESQPNARRVREDRVEYNV
jgi:four helix bundle protein